MSVEVGFVIKRRQTVMTTILVVSAVPAQVSLQLLHSPPPQQQQQCITTMYSIPATNTHPVSN